MPLLDINQAQKKSEADYRKQAFQQVRGIQIFLFHMILASPCLLECSRREGALKGNGIYPLLVQTYQDLFYRSKTVETELWNRMPR